MIKNKSLRSSSILHLTSYFLLLFFCFLLLSSCGVRKAATAITADILTRGMVEIETENDTFVAKEVSLPLLKVAEVMHDGDPDNKKFLSLLSKSYGNYAFGIAELRALENGKDPVEWSQRSKNFYARGKRYGLLAISSGKKNASDLTLVEFKKRIGKFGKKDTETLFWTAFNWGQHINLNRDDIGSVAELPMVDALIDRIIETDDSFQCGISYAFKGVMIAGNPLQGPSRFAVTRPMFDKALSFCDGNFLMTKVMFAEWYAKPSGDNKLFNDTLVEVINADAGKLPRYRLANELAKERAKLLLNKK